MKDLICDWLRKKEGHITLIEDGSEITFIYRGGSLLLATQLTSTRADCAALQLWACLGAASLAHFQGALAQKPDTGALWLTQSLKGDLDESSVLNYLAALLNQRDTWRATFARLRRSSLRFKPTPLRSQLY